MAGVEGKVALVTGAGRGIGRETAALLSSRGAHVMAVARSENELRQTGFDYTVADLGTIEGCERTVAETLDRLGRIDIFVCNHGLGSAHEKLIWEQEKATWQETMRINLDGPFYLSRLIVKGMVEQQYGRAIYVSSTAALQAEKAGSAYNCSKLGLIGLMRSVAQDADAYNVTSNAVLPGWVRTEMAERSARAEAAASGITTDEVWRQRESLYAPGRVATPREVAEMIAFLASEEASGVSAQAIAVSLGGLS